MLKKKCAGCGNIISNYMAKCPNCGKEYETEAMTFTDPEHDKLERFWYYLIWGFILVPVIGMFVQGIIASFCYYSWKKIYPKRARTINNHSWLAFIAGIIYNTLLFNLTT